MIVFVEGNIGSGKSTLLQHIHNETKHDQTVKVVYESLADWLQVSDGVSNILDYFYYDQQKYGFALQMVILTQRYYQIKQIIQEMKAKGREFLIVMERSSASCDEVFRKIIPLYNIEHAAFDYIYKKIKEDTDYLGVVSKYIYLDTPPEVCVQRIQQRGREEEKTIQIEYLQLLQKQYMQLVKSTGAVVVNGDRPQKAVLRDINDILTQFIVTDYPTGCK